MSAVWQLPNHFRFLCKCPLSLREPGSLLGTQSSCNSFYLFFAGFPGLQGPAGPPGAPGLSLPSVIARQSGDPGRPGLDGKRGKDRKPKRELANTFCLKFGEVPYIVQLHLYGCKCMGLLGLTSLPQPGHGQEQAAFC